MTESLHHTLDSKHKASLQKFVDKNEWIQSQIAHLESSALPAMDDADQVLDDTILSKLIQEHDRMEARVQELDNGELRALRLLAKAAAQKSLSPQDTDLIEITLKVLFSVDKLLHLLRLRGKALHLLQLRSKWTGLTCKVESDLDSILRNALPAFAKKARWSEPQGSVNDDKRKARLSDASTHSSAHPHVASHSLHSSMTSNSTMARQMRAEILSLDLASLTSRIHTLSYSTLKSSARVLDTMVDTSPAPLPESFLDRQDDLEARVKHDLQGVGEFCQALAKQWKQVDDAYWTCKEVESAAESLQRDIAQATLKLPSEILAKEYEDRLEIALSIFNTVKTSAVDTLSLPSLPAHVPDQGMYNLQITDALRAIIVKTLKTVNEAQQAVQAYRIASQALAAAQSYSQEVFAALSSLRNARDSLILVPIQVETMTSKTSELEAAQTKNTALSEQARHVQDTVLPRAQGVVQDLLTNGIDPNVRRSLQDSVSALSREVEQVIALTHAETEKITMLLRTRSLAKSVDQHKSELDTIQADLLEAVKSTLLAEEQGSPTTGSESFRAQLHKLHEAAESDIETFAAVRTLLNRALESAVSPDKKKIVSHLQEKVASFQACLAAADGLLDLLQRATTQRTAIATAYQDGSELKADIKRLQVEVCRSNLSHADLTALQERQDQLDSRVKSFDSSLSTQISFLAGAAPIAGIDLKSHDTAVRTRFNQSSAELWSMLNSLNSTCISLRDACATYITLKKQQSNIRDIVAQADSVFSDATIGNSDRLRQVQALQLQLEAVTSVPEGTSMLNVKVSNLKQAMEEMQATEAEILRERDMAGKKLVAILEQCVARVSADEARQKHILQEAELRGLEAQRHAAEDVLQQCKAEYHQIGQMCIDLSSVVNKSKQGFESSIWDGRSLRQLQDWQAAIKQQRVQADEVQKQLGVLSQENFFETFEGFEDLEVNVRGFQEATHQSYSDLLETLAHSQIALNAAQTVNAEGAKSRQEAEELAARQHRLSEMNVSMEKVESLLYLRTKKVEDTAAQLKSCSDLEELDKIGVEETESLHAQIQEVVQRLQQVPEGNADGTRKPDLQDRLEKIVKQQEALAKLEIALQASMVLRRKELKQMHVLQHRELEDEAIGTGLAEHGTPTSLQDQLTNNLEAAVPDANVRSHNIVNDPDPDPEPSLVRAEDVFGPRLSTSGNSGRLENITPTIDDSSPESICSSLPAEEDATTSGLPADDHVSIKRDAELPKALQASLELDDALISNEADTPSPPTTASYNETMKQQDHKQAFEQAAIAADEAISRIMDHIDALEAGTGIESIPQKDIIKAGEAVQHLKSIAPAFGDDHKAQSRLDHLQDIWQEVQEHLHPPTDISPPDSKVAASSSGGSSTSSFITSSQRSASSLAPKRSVSSASQSAARRVASLNPSSRLPVSASRSRKDSTASMPSDSTASPAPSKLPQPVSSASRNFQSPTLASASRRLPIGKTYSVLSGLGAPRLPTPSASRAIHTSALSDIPAFNSPIRRHRSSNRRSSAAQGPDGTNKPNSYRPKPDHKLDEAVGRIVNNMQVPVSITPHEVHRDEVGNYWIGDPPKLYYARILRSRTVMLRVGGGWQELGSFLSTHYDQLLSTVDGILTPRPPTEHGTSNTPGHHIPEKVCGGELWLSASSLKDSQSQSHSRRQSFKSPRSASLHMSPFKHSQTSSDVPFDLTSLLMKSTSRSPPAPRPATSQRNISAPAPWRI